MLYFPLPYEDEPLYGVIGRYVNRVGSVQGEKLASNIFERRTSPNLLLPNGLNRIAERTRLNWRLTGEEVANRLTILPYYTNFLNTQRAKHCMEELLSNNANLVALHLGLGWRIRPLGNLRFCPVCRSLDLTKYGETYWRRAHQLNGVLVCPEHGEPLLGTGIGIRQTRTRYIDATSATQISSYVKDTMSDSDTELAQRIAVRCKEMLSKASAKWDTDDYPLAYRQESIRLGFTKNRVIYSYSKMEGAFLSFYGRPLLAKLDCDLLGGSQSNWLRRAFRSSIDDTHPLHHMLIQIFFESHQITEPLINPIGSGPWKCPNPHAQHEDKYPLKKCTVRRRSNGDYVASARCDCGFCFTFTRTCDADLRLPVVREVVRWGRLWKEEAMKLRQSGLSMRAIAKKMGITKRVVQGLLSSKPSPDDKRLPKIAKWRKQWLALLDHVPHRSRHEARKKDAKLYDKLLRHDREWLFIEDRRYSKKVISPKKKIDWSIRDQEWSTNLINAAEHIKQISPTKRLSNAAIFRAVGKSFNVRTNLNRLPLCTQVLLKYSESLLEYQERRLIRAAKLITQKGLSLNRSALLRYGGLHGRYLNPHLESVLHSLLTNS